VDILWEISIQQGRRRFPEHETVVLPPMPPLDTATLVLASTVASEPCPSIHPSHDARSRGFLSYLGYLTS